MSRRDVRFVRCDCCGAEVSASLGQGYSEAVGPWSYVFYPGLPDMLDVCDACAELSIVAIATRVKQRAAGNS